MYNRYKILTLNILPVLLLAVVVVASFRLVKTEETYEFWGFGEIPDRDFVTTQVMPQAVVPRAVVIEANAPLKESGHASNTVPAEAIASADVPHTGDLRLGKQIPGEVGAQGKVGGAKITSADGEPSATKEEVWAEITDAISGLNSLVGAEMFLDVSRQQKGQMEVRLNAGLWQRVRYQTRANLKTDISNLWHLYVKQYGNVDSSVVYFMDGSDDKVIDIFSRAN